MVTFTLITNISQTSLELQSAFLVTLISEPAGLTSGRVCSCSVCGSVEKTYLLHVFISNHSCLYEVHFKDCWLLTPLQEKVIIGVAYDCVEKMVYWTEITSPSISKASIEGGEPTEIIQSGSVTVYFFLSLYWFSFIFSHLWLIKQWNWCVNLLTDLGSPEGITIDHLGRTMFWTDSMKDRIEVASLDGSQRRVIINSDLVNPRAVIADPPNGCVLSHMKPLRFSNLSI